MCPWIDSIALPSVPLHHRIEALILDDPLVLIHVQLLPYPQERDGGSSLHSPRVGLFRLKFVVADETLLLQCCPPHPSQQFGKQDTKKKWEGASRGQPCCKLPFLHQQVQRDYYFVKSNICWGVGVWGGGGAVLGISWADARDAWGRPASPTNQSSKLQGFYQREQLGEVVCSHLRNGFCHWWLDTGWRKRNLTIRNERSLIWIC